MIMKSLMRVCVCVQCLVAWHIYTFSNLYPHKMGTFYIHCKHLAITIVVSRWPLLIKFKWAKNDLLHCHSSSQFYKQKSTECIHYIHNNNNNYSEKEPKKKNDPSWSLPLSIVRSNEHINWFSPFCERQ